MFAQVGEMRIVWLQLCSSLTAANGFLSIPRALLSSIPTQQRQRHQSGLRLSLDSGSPPVSSADSDGLVVGLNKYSHDSSICILSNR